jgi:predicted peptidase
LIAEGNDILQNDNEIVDEEVTLFVRHEERSYQSNPSIGDGYEHAYMLYKPEAYYKNVDEKFPLLIFLHGAGERGTLNYQKLRRNGPPKLIEKGVEMPFIVASPQIPETPDGWLANITDEFLSKLQDELRIDASRIYITGISLGGNGTFRYTAAYPEKVAAAVPISGWGSGNWCESARVPIWAFHNNDDMVVPAQDTRNAVININNCGLQPQAEMTIYESGGHDAWTKTYDGSAGHDIYSWMLSYTK